METKQNSNSDKKKMLIYLLITFLNTIEYFWISSIFPASIISRLVFLTMISLFINWFYYFLRLLTHLEIKLIEEIKERRIFKFGFSLSFLVVVMYWGMIISDPQTLYKAEASIPIVLDLMLHGCNFLFNLLEHIVINRRVNDRDSFIGWKFYFIFAALYTIEIKAASYFLDFHAYPIVQQMNIPITIFLNIVAMLIMLGGEFIYNKISMLGIKKLLTEEEHVK